MLVSDQWWTVGVWVSSNQRQIPFPGQIAFNFPSVRVAISVIEKHNLCDVSVKRRTVLIVSDVAGRSEQRILVYHSSRSFIHSCAVEIVVVCRAIRKQLKDVVIRANCR